MQLRKKISERLDIMVVVSIMKAFIFWGNFYFVKVKYVSITEPFGAGFPWLASAQ